MTKQRNIWMVIAIILMIILIFILTIQYPEKDKEIEYQKTCLDNCISVFDACLNDIPKPTFPSNPEILHCLWNESFCVENCQLRDYKLQKAMGEIK